MMVMVSLEKSPTSFNVVITTDHGGEKKKKGGGEGETTLISQVRIVEK